MTCRFSKDTLALHATGDLGARAAAGTERHIERCPECRRVLDELREQRRMLQLLRRDADNPGEGLSVRHAVMSTIREHQDTTGWWLRLERMLVLGVRQHAYAVAACVLIGIASASAVAQIRYGPPSTPAVHSAPAAPIFEGADTLILPADYRDWISMRRDRVTESPVGTAPRVEDARSASTVYVHPAAFREFQASGIFPDGTVFLWVSPHDLSEMSVQPHGGSSVLLASVKDGRRFDDGWGFFDFTAGDGEVLAKARALPESRGCRTCHRGDVTVADPVLVPLRSART